MQVFQVPLTDVFTTNGYFYIDEETRRGFLIDPAAEGERLLSIVRGNGWTIEAMLLTHGHFDHTGAVQFLHDALGVPYKIHRNGAQYLLDARLNLSAFCGRHSVLSEAEYLDGGDTLALPGSSCGRLSVLHTPGHTTDSATYYDAENGVAFVGDTIFRGAAGTTQYPGGNPAQLAQSIRDVIFSLPDETALYSGHSEPTTVGRERLRLC